METAAARFSRLDNAVAELGQRTGQLDKEISAVKGRVEVGFSTLAAKVDQSADAMTATVDGLAASVTGLAASVTGVGGQVQLVHGRIERLDTRLERLDERLDDQYDRVSAIDSTLTAVDGKLGTLGGRLDGLDGRLESLGQWPAEIQDAVAKIVDAAQHDVTAHLGSLEDTVLTLAEALLRPSGRPVPAPREGTRGLATRRQDSAAPDDRYWGGPRGLG
jgi:chromosome segregation ATPase